MKLEDLTLKKTGVVAGVYGSSSKIPRITINELGLILSVEEVDIEAEQSKDDKTK